LLGGLALFLFGMDQMAESIKAVAGKGMKGILAKLTANRFMGAATGAFITAVVQSSSITTVLVVGFISTGLMSMSQSIGVIMGANIGSTVTAQIIAFKITHASMLMIAIGFGMLFFIKQEKIKLYRNILMGLGMVFFGMTVMSGAMAPLRSYQPFLDLIMHMENPLISILIATLFTGLIQSSAATTGIVIVMAAQGFINLPTGIALAFGANIGTCVTAILASIGKPREAVRAAMVHILFNIFGVLLWVGFIDQLAQLVTWLSPSYELLTGAAKMAAETPRQIANAHTLFNIANTIIFIGFTSQFARLVEWLIPDRPMKESQPITPKFLNEEFISTPSLALDRTRLEIGQMGEQVREMLALVMPTILSGNRDTLTRIAAMDDVIDITHGYVITYLGQISKQPLTNAQTHEFTTFMGAANSLENIGDIIETDLVELGHKRIDEDVIISKNTQEVLLNLHEAISKAVDLSIQAVIENNHEAALHVISMKSSIKRQTDAATVYEAKRLIAEEPKRLQAYTIEMDTIEKLKRIYYFAKRMATATIPNRPAKNHD
jgi:phosphate:Na+ symporter